VLVTGATGGVGSVAIALLAQLGHKVVAATGKAAEADYLRRSGAAVIDRAELSAPGKPLQKERWSAVVDAVGQPHAGSTHARSVALRRAVGALRAGAGHGPSRRRGALSSCVRPLLGRGQRDGRWRCASRRGRGWRATWTELLESSHGDSARRSHPPPREADGGQVRGRIVVRRVASASSAPERSRPARNAVLTRDRRWIASTVVHSRPMPLRERRTCAPRAMLPSGFISSHSTPPACSRPAPPGPPAASVWPCRSSTPPARAISGNTWPGLTISLCSSVERSAHWMVCTRSAADTPVLTPCAASIDCVNAVA
jgi:hypothetical protein